MKICFVVDQWETKQNTAQVKIMRLLMAHTGQYHSFQVLSAPNLKMLLVYNPDVIHSNGYKMTALVWIINKWVGARHFALLSETPEKLWFKWFWFWFLKRVERVFVTSEYIRNKLGFGEVVRIGNV